MGLFLGSRYNTEETTKDNIFYFRGFKGAGPGGTLGSDHEK